MTNATYRETGQCGIYEVELRTQIIEPSKILCNPNKLYDEIVNKARNRVWTQHTWNMKPLNPNLKLAATLRHPPVFWWQLFRQYSRRVARKTLSLVVRVVCNAMCKEYVDEVMIYSWHMNNGNNWLMVSPRCWTLINCDATIDGKYIVIRKRATSGFFYYKYKFLSVLSYWLLSAQTTS